MTDAFADRHIGTDSVAQLAMLDAVGYDTVDALMDAAVPAGIRVAPDAPARIPPAATEREALAELRALAGRNRVRRSDDRPRLLRHASRPSVIQRNVLENPSWYTAYTPYQPEISQGRLEALINFQTMVDRPHRDWRPRTRRCSTRRPRSSRACCWPAARPDRRRTCSSSMHDALPQTKALLEHRAEAVGIELHYTAFDHVATPADIPTCSARSSSTPARPAGSGTRARSSRRCTRRTALVVVAADLLALTLLKSPGRARRRRRRRHLQRFGVPMGFGGPHAGYMAVRDGLERQLPGPPRRRLAGCRRLPRLPALSLQTREQHIRREKATSNICTAQVLLAVMASMYAVYHGPGGLKRIAQQVHRLGRLDRASASATSRSCTRASSTRSPCTCPDAPADVVAAARDAGINSAGSSTTTHVAVALRRDDDSSDDVAGLPARASASSEPARARAGLASGDPRPTLVRYSRGTSSTPCSTPIAPRRR